MVPGRSKIDHIPPIPAQFAPVSTSPPHPSAGPTHPCPKQRPLLRPLHRPDNIATIIKALTKERWV